MNRIVTQSMAACAALFLTIITISAIVTVPPVEAAGLVALSPPVLA